MLNEILMGDEKDKEIARLNMIINKFKEYDKERKEYYSKKMKRLGQLESYVDEIDSGTHITKLKETIKRQQKELSRLNNIISVYKSNGLIVNDDVDKDAVIINLRNQIKTLIKQNNNYKKTVAELIYKLNFKDGKQ